MTRLIRARFACAIGILVASAGAIQPALAEVTNRITTMPSAHCHYVSYEGPIERSTGGVVAIARSSCDGNLQLLEADYLGESGRTYLRLEVSPEGPANVQWTYVGYIHPLDPGGQATERDPEHHFFAVVDGHLRPRSDDPSEAQLAENLARDLVDLLKLLFPDREKVLSFYESAKTKTGQAPLFARSYSDVLQRFGE